MTRKKKQRTGMSPYKKYNKAPYHYAHKTCSCKTTVKQSVPNWAGVVCTVCNTIAKKFD